MAVVISKTEALALQDLIGTILAAVIDAQAQSARATVDFINDVGFVSGGEGNPERLRTVHFRYTKLDENQQPAEFTVELPLLGLVDIPLVTVKKATIAFAYEITDATPPVEGAAQPSPATAGLWARVATPAMLRGRVAERAADTGERATLNIAIDLEKSELPVGLNRVLDILQVAAAEAKAPGQAGGGG